MLAHLFVVTDRDGGARGGNGGSAPSLAPSANCRSVYTSRWMGGRAAGGQVNSIMLTSELARRNDTVVVVVAVLAVGVEAKSKHFSLTRGRGLQPNLR